IGVSRALVSPDGFYVSYGTAGDPNTGLFVVPASGGIPKRVSDRPHWVHSWRHDNHDLLYMGASQNRTVMRLDLATGSTSLFLAKPGVSLYQAKYSPDDQWLTFGSGSDASDSRVYVVKLQNGMADPGSRWILVSDEHGWSDKPTWSPDGNTLY